MLLIEYSQERQALIHARLQPGGMKLKSLIAFNHFNGFSGKSAGMFRQTLALRENRETVDESSMAISHPAEAV